MASSTYPPWIYYLPFSTVVPSRVGSSPLGSSLVGLGAVASSTSGLMVGRMPEVSSVVWADDVVDAVRFECASCQVDAAVGVSCQVLSRDPLPASRFIERVQCARHGLQTRASPGPPSPLRGGGRGTPGGWGMGDDGGRGGRRAPWPVRAYVVAPREWGHTESGRSVHSRVSGGLRAGSVASL